PTQGLRARHCVGPSRVVHLSDRAQGARRAAVHRLHRSWTRKAARRRRAGLAADSRPVHRERDLRDWRKGGRRADRQRQAHAARERMKKIVPALVTFAAVTSIGCSVATTVQRNTDAINRSSETIGTNTQAVSDSTKATGT